MPKAFPRAALVAAALLCTLTSSVFGQRRAAPPATDFVRLREETAQRLAEYLRINTSNPPGNELATARWVAWWNRERLHGACGNLPPAEFEAAYWHRQEAPIAVA